MMRSFLPYIALWCFLAAPALSHHADPLYDMDHPITLAGVVTRVEWSNPHVYVHVNVSGEKGDTEQWALELTAPHSLRRYGWTNTTVKAGDRIIFTGGRARSGARALRCSSIQLSDGKKLRV
jgi:hypothetical protein